MGSLGRNLTHDFMGYLLKFLCRLLSHANTLIYLGHETTLTTMFCHDRFTSNQELMGKWQLSALQSRRGFYHFSKTPFSVEHYLRVCRIPK